MKLAQVNSLTFQPPLLSYLLQISTWIVYFLLPHLLLFHPFLSGYLTLKFILWRFEQRKPPHRSRDPPTRSINQQRTSPFHACRDDIVSIGSPRSSATTKGSGARNIRRIASPRLGDEIANRFTRDNKPGVNHQDYRPRRLRQVLWYSSFTRQHFILQLSSVLHHQCQLPETEVSRWYHVESGLRGWHLVSRSLSCNLQQSPMNWSCWMYIHIYFTDACTALTKLRNIYINIILKIRYVLIIYLLIKENVGPRSESAWNKTQLYCVSFHQISRLICGWKHFHYQRCITIFRYFTNVWKGFAN